MNRRGFLIGSLLSTGAAFMCNPLVINPPRPKTPVDRMEAILRLFNLPESELMKCRILYVKQDDRQSYFMPGLLAAKVSRQRGEIVFRAQPLIITEASSWLGIRFLDDRGMEFCEEYTPFGYVVNTIFGDTLIATYSLQLGIK